MATDRDIARGGIGGKGERDRNPMDFYSTPDNVTDALLDFLKYYRLLCYEDIVYEPACGDGNMCEMIKRHGVQVVYSDIRYTEYAGENGGIDFMGSGAYQFIKNSTWIITNPPFNVSTDFIRRCLDSGKRFALLLKSQYWHSASRQDLFWERVPRYVCPLTWRPAFTGKANLMDFIWTVWTEERFGTTEYIPLAKPKAEGQMSFI